MATNGRIARFWMIWRGELNSSGAAKANPNTLRAMSARIATDLPIEPLIPEILGALGVAPNLVLEAPPGAGKTTRVPLALLDADWAKGDKIIVLEPRRLAARGAAARMAAMLGEEVGETVGYRVRLDRKVGPKTRIEVVTTGLFLRQLQGDPALPGVAAILFDEFHERTIEGDMALAFALEAQAGLREDLRLLVMSATLDGEGVAQRMPGAVGCAAKDAPSRYETHHLGHDAIARLEDRHGGGNPPRARRRERRYPRLPAGTAESARTQDRLAGEDRATVLPLYGDLPLAEQDKAIRRDPQGKRKIILATSIAETSLTIDGVRIVVDSGLRRSPRFDPASGMSRLVTIKASLAATAQRRGRAGRTESGVCYRLWSAASERALPAFDAPEIEAADLAPLALELAAWGIADPAALTLMTATPRQPCRRRARLSRQLEAIDGNNLATPHGRRMAEIGVHPRLAHMMVRAGERGLGDLACDIAAILSERDFLKGRESDADLRHRGNCCGTSSSDPALDRNQRSRVRQSALDWRRQLGVKKEAQSSSEQCGRSWLWPVPTGWRKARGPRASSASATAAAPCCRRAIRWRHRISWRRDRWTAMRARPASSSPRRSRSPRSKRISLPRSKSRPCSPGIRAPRWWRRSASGACGRWCWRRSRSRARRRNRSRAR